MPAEEDSSENLSSSLVGPSGCTSCRYERVGLLERGSLGKSLLVRRTSDGLLLVAKRFELAAMTNKDREQVDREIHCLAACKHFAVTRYYEHWEDGRYLWVITEHANAGDVSHQIQRRAAEAASGSTDSAYFAEHEIRHILVLTALGLHHMHTQASCTHRDLRPASVMLFLDGMVKLGYNINDGIDTKPVGFPDAMFYTSPETTLSLQPTEKSDMWALGVVLFELLTLQKPFVGSSGIEGMSQRYSVAVVRNVIVSLVSGRRSCEPSTQYSRELRDICDILLNREVDERPSMEDFFKLPQMCKIADDFLDTLQDADGLSLGLREQIRDGLQAVRPATTLANVVIRPEVEFEGTVRAKNANGEWRECLLVLYKGNLFISAVLPDDPVVLIRLDTAVSVSALSERTTGAAGMFAVHLADASSVWFQAMPAETASLWLEKLREVTDYL